MAKNLILLVAISALTGLFNLILVNKAMAAYGIDVRVKQVKIQNSPTVYYLDHKLGLKKAYVSAAAYLSYGNKWSDVKTISQNQLDKWPDVKLVKLAGEKNIYYIQGNKKSLIKGPSDLKSLGFNFVATIKPADFLSYQTADYSTIGLTSGSSKTLAKAGGGDPGFLTVGLDQNSPATGFLPMDSRHNKVAIFDFKAGSVPAEVSQIVLNLPGVFNSGVVEKIYLTNKDGYILGETDGLNNRQASFSFGADPITLAAGETEIINVYVDLKSYPDFTNNFLKVSLNSNQDIKANVVIDGNFPLTTGEFKFVAGSLMGQVKVEELALNSGNSLIIGSSEKIIGKFNLNETSNKENSVITKITLINLGNARSADLANFKLRDSGNRLLSQSATMTDDTVTFNLNNYILSKGQSATLLFSADIIGGEDRTVNFNLRDFYSNGDNYGYGLGFSQTDSNEAFIIARESLNVLSNDLIPSRLVFSKQSGVIIGNFQVRNNNQSIRLQNLSVSLEKSANAPILNQAVYLVNYDTGEVYDSTDGSKLTGGSSLSFNSLALAANQTLNFSLVTNLPTISQNGDKYRIKINKISYRYDNNLYFEDNLTNYGNYLTVNKSSLYIYPNNVDWDRNYIKGQKNIKIASFTIEAAAGADSYINQVTLANSSDTSGLVLYDNGFSNLSLYIGGSRVGNVIDRPTASSLIFNNFNYRFAAGGRAEISLYADTERDLKASQAQLIIFSIGATSKDSYIPSAISGLNSTSRQVYFGETQAEIKIIDGGSFIPGTSNNNVGSFSITNSGAEDIGLDKFTIITSSYGFSYSLGFSNLRIIEASSLREVSAVSRPVAGANLIGLGGYTIEPGQTVEFIIQVSASDTAPTNGFEIFLSQLSVYGRKSGLKVDVEGDPTGSVSVNLTSSRVASVEVGASASIRLNWPVDSRIVNYGFHDPNYPFRSTAEHDGIDIAVDQGTPVKAAAAGSVADVSDTHTTQYNYVTIDHGNGLKTVYGHLSVINVKLGDTVTSGQVIGLSGGLPGSIGSGPNTNGPHLHFGVILNGVAVDPMGYLQ